MKIESFTKSNLKSVRTEIETALNKVGEKLGISLSIGNISFNADQFTSKLTANSTTDKGEVNQKEWDRFCLFTSFDKDDFGKSFIQGGTTYTICGVKARSRKYPILAKNASGTTYKFGEEIKAILIK